MADPAPIITWRLAARTPQFADGWRQQCRRTVAFHLVVDWAVILMGCSRGKMVSQSCVRLFSPGLSALLLLVYIPLWSSSPSMWYNPFKFTNEDTLVCGAIMKPATHVQTPLATATGAIKRRLGQDVIYQ